MIILTDLKKRFSGFRRQEGEQDLAGALKAHSRSWLCYLVVKTTQRGVKIEVAGKNVTSTCGLRKQIREPFTLLMNFCQ